MNRKFKTDNKILVVILLSSIVLFSVRLYFTGNYRKVINHINSSNISYDGDISNQKILKDQEYSLDGIKKIYTNVIGRVMVSYSENDKARVIIYRNSQDKDKDNIKIEKRNNQFNIVDKRGSNSFKINIFGENDRYIVKLYIPKKYSDDIELRTSAGEIEYKDVKANNLKIVSSAGKIKGKNIEAKNIELEASAGLIDIDGFKGKLECDNEAGRTNLKCTELVDDINIENSAGKIKLYIPEKSQFNLNAKTTAGKINNEFENEGMSQKTEPGEDSLKGKVGSGKYNIHLENSAGKIDILKTK